jgi:DNA-directed RNA polymerases I, II, and III subunit RPABC1
MGSEYQRPTIKEMSTVVEAITQRYRLRTKLAELASHRGWTLNVPHFEEYMMKFSDIMEQEESIGIPISEAANPTKMVSLAFISSEKKIGRESAQKILAQCKETTYTDNPSTVKPAILVTRDSLTPSAREDLDRNRFTIDVEVFTYDEIINDPYSYYGQEEYKSLGCRTPPITYRILPEQEVAVREKLFGTREHWPSIQYNDPSARYFGLKIGQVMEATYMSETAGRYRILRVCGNDPAIEKDFVKKGNSDNAKK